MTHDAVPIRCLDAALQTRGHPPCQRTARRWHGPISEHVSEHVFGHPPIGAVRIGLSRIGAAPMGGGGGGGGGGRLQHRDGRHQSVAAGRQRSRNEKQCLSKEKQRLSKEKQRLGNNTEEP